MPNQIFTPPPTTSATTGFASQTVILETSSPRRSYSTVRSRVRLLGFYFSSYQHHTRLAHLARLDRDLFAPEPILRLVDRLLSRGLLALRRRRPTILSRIQPSSISDPLIPSRSSLRSSESFTTVDCCFVCRRRRPDIPILFGPLPLVTCRSIASPVIAARHRCDPPSTSSPWIACAV